ncbi:hypothetical protein ALI144C_01795 [Actinosynnema sp. ALI-1.44]|uniref:hypothetical protein n=1 Tax=Actinosynnema sp. ALI-1.44 TaxID=1933779 RepID=UPI00097BD457|nr:hypothetical protein [Actinosynnema sp. ALI-1.44]ONI90985.1 hypothetical protein ALI144C_01795 [Actinosynnema sp. ALI-1.44]
MNGRERAKALITEGKFEELRQLADEGDKHARLMYGDLLVLCGDEAALQAREAWYHLVSLLARQGRTEEVRALVGTHCPNAVPALAHLLARQGRLDELAELRVAGSYEAGRHVADILVAQGRIDELRQHADAGNRSALTALARVLADREDIDGLRALAHDSFAEEQLIEVLAKAKRYPEAIALRRARTGQRRARMEEHKLNELLRRAGHEQELRERAQTDENALDHLVRFYAWTGRADELRTIAETGHQEAMRRLFELLEEHENVDELRKYADEGHRSAVYALVNVYRKQERIDEIRAMASANIADSRYQLAEILRERDEVDELRARAAADASDPAFRELVGWLSDHGQVDELEVLSRTGDSWAVAAVARLAPERLWARAEAGDADVLWQLRRAFSDRNDVDELRRLAAIGDEQAQGDFLGKLSQLGLVDELKARADADEPHAMTYWIEHLAKQERVDELRALADEGQALASIRLAEVLGEQGRFAEVVARAEAGDRHAARRLAFVIAPPFNDNPEDRVRP